MDRNPESNAPDTYTGPTTSPEGYPYQFGLRGGSKDSKGEDPSKLYVINGADGKPLTNLLYDGKQFGNVSEIAAYRADMVRQGYTTAHADTNPDDISGAGYPQMDKAAVDVALAGFDKAKTDKERFANVSPKMVHALQNRGWRSGAIAAAVKEHGGKAEARTETVTSGAPAASSSATHAAQPASSSTGA